MDVDFKKMRTKDVALMYRKGHQAITHWKNDGLPTNGDGTYDSIVVTKHREAKAYEQGKKEGESLAPSSGSERETDAKEIYAQAKAGREVLKLAGERGDFARREDVERQFARAFTVFSQNLQSLPSSLATKLENKTPKEMQDIIERHLRQSLDSMKRVYEETKEETG